MKRSIVYIASPYSKGDPAINTHFQCKIFNQMLNDGRVWPVVPLWTHFQHTVFPRSYKDWIEYDQALLHLYDACLRLDIDIPELDYSHSESSGADAEVETFKSLGKTVFFSIHELYSWADELHNDDGHL
jgi:hypothetical protein